MTGFRRRRWEASAAKWTRPLRRIGFAGKVSEVCRPAYCDTSAAVETGSGNQYSISLSFPPRRSPAGAKPGAGKRGSQWEAVRAQCRGLGKPPSLVSCVGDAREKGSESNIQSNTDLQRTTGTTNREASMKADRQAGFPSAQAERALVSRIMRDLPRRCSRSFGDMNFDLTGDLSFL